MFVLKIYEGAKDPKAHRFDPDSDTYTIGRSARCDRLLTDRRVSNSHCTLVRAREDWILYDGDPQSEGWAERIPKISAGYIVKKTIAMLPGMVVTLIDVSDYKVTLERERDDSKVTTGGDHIDRSTIEEQQLTPGLLISILDDFIASLKPIIEPLVDSNAIMIESSEALISRVVDADSRHASELAKLKEVDRKYERDLYALNKLVMYGSGVVLLATAYSLSRGDKEITNKVIDLVIAVVSSGLLIKTATVK